ncbi:MAG: L-seryl-tRNA(Sec) selenium transferase [Bacteroidales bacterium]|nr:L-seryl-tRNA(Sec) selenium transferase [Bacteroidales bacterium]
MESKKETLKNLPGIDKLLSLAEIKSLIEKYSEDLVKYIIRSAIDRIRKQAIKSGEVPSIPEIVSIIQDDLIEFRKKSLRNVINATGVVVHTNLGRAPFSDAIISEAAEILKGYNNLEFDLDKGERGSRNTHLAKLLKYLTGAEDILVVNNNAAALMLILRTFAKEKEVIVSRGELIEIGGSFRLPDIMAASDCVMVEVGTTNKTKIEDYEEKVNKETALLLKAHQSNFVIQGFTQEASLTELVSLGKKTKVPVVYDMGSGLLRKTSLKVFEDEPDVKQTLATGINLVCFSGDKLLGGAQAGIIAGKKEFIAILKKEPMVRALRVGKTTLALMEAALSYYLDDKDLFEKNMLFSMMIKKPEEIKNKAGKLQKILSKHQIPSTLVESKGQCGGGALPGKEIDSYALRIDNSLESNKKKSEFAEKLYFGLMKHQSPVVSILRKGDVYFDVLTVPEEQFEKLAKILKDIYSQIK